ncbi:class I SAM-dependent methyltransferase [Candidatus Eisenbacteria bacterium]|uniref:Class I SAM-dependent methyltransferase n=1 Tax=Eiseniibacteriota bacterium TaxID=2212470 RepID=A0ABV6YJ24_UNCEI
MNEVYKNPKYYEIAFSFRDVVAEVDVFEQVIEQYSRIPVSTVLELGCGHAPHVAELARRKYQYIGLDLNPAMLEYARDKANAVDALSQFELADMTDFRLAEQVDFAFVLLGSLQARNTAELVSHFDSVGRALKHGGLYFLDWCVAFSPSNQSVESWEMARGQVKVKTTSQTHLIDPAEQIFEESLTLEVEDGGAMKVFRETFTARQVYPQEFLLLIAARSDFEFVGWWNNWDMSQPLDKTREISRPITVLRRVCA